MVKKILNKKISRRGFLVRSSFLGLAFIFSLLTKKLPAGSKAIPLDELYEEEKMDFATAFDFAVEKNKWFKSFKGVESDAIPSKSIFVFGDLPKKIRGLFMKIGPGYFYDGGARFRHFYEGIPFLQQIVVNRGKIGRSGQLLNIPPNFFTSNPQMIDDDESVDQTGLGLRDQNDSQQDDDEFTDGSADLTITTEATLTNKGPDTESQSSESDSETNRDGEEAKKPIKAIEYARFATPFSLARGKLEIQNNHRLIYHAQKMYVVSDTALAYTIADSFKNPIKGAYPLQINKEGKANWKAKKNSTSRSGAKNTLLNQVISPHSLVDRQDNLFSAVSVYKDSNAPVEGIALKRFNKVGKLVVNKIFQLENVGYIHSFAMTTNFLVVVVPPLLLSSPLKEDVLSSFQWRGDMPSKVFVFDKKKLDLVLKAEMAASFTQHWVNAYEEDDRIIFEGMDYRDASIFKEGYQNLMRGVWSTGKEDEKKLFPALTRFILSGNNEGVGRVTKELLASEKEGYEFPSIDPREIGVKHTLSVMIRRKSRDYSSTGVPYYRSVVVKNYKNNQISSWRYGANEVVDEHLYLFDKSRPPGEGGWVIGTTYNFKTGNSYCYIFDALKMGEGPRIKALLKAPFYPSMHGTFIEQ